MLKKHESEKPKRHSGGLSTNEEFNKFYLLNDSSICESLLLLLDDIYKNLPQTKGVIADQVRDKSVIENRLKTQGTSFATKLLPSLADSLFNYLENGISDYHNFKIQSGEKYPAFLRQFFSLIYSTTSSESSRVWAIAAIYQVSVLFKKLKGPYKQSVLVKQVDDFVEVDTSLSKLNLEAEWASPILQHARGYINNIFNDVHMDDFRHILLPRPGPGATNTPVEKHMRYEPHVLYDQIDEKLPYVEFFYPTLADFAHQARDILRLKRRKRPMSRFKQVHKTFGKSRGICIEENEMQFMQQMVKRFLCHILETHCMTRGKINFTKQCINQTLALKSSENGIFATIDMSEASDRIARSLVDHLFKDQPDVRDALIALSTQIIELPDWYGRKFLPTMKYAPMGSGLCFPVMALVHYVLIKAIINLSSIQNKDYALDHIYVYGDDIIIPVNAVQAVFDYLPLFGMKLNMNKSFHRGKFRESCGVHAYNGVDITPIFIKKMYNKGSGTEDLLSVVAVESQLFNKGFTCLAAKMRRDICDTEREIPFVSEKSPLLGFRREWARPHHAYSAGNVKSRWNRDLQCKEYRLRVLVNLLDELPPMVGVNGYLRKLVTKDREAQSSKASSNDFLIRWKWISEASIAAEAAISPDAFSSRHLDLPSVLVLRAMI